MIRSFFKNDGILIVRLVIPLVLLAGLSLWISTRYERDIFVNVATDFISIIITVFYVDWVMKLYDESNGALQTCISRPSVALLVMDLLATSQNTYGLIAAKRTSIDLKRGIDSAVNIIETFGFEPREPDIDYEAEIRRI